MALRHGDAAALAEELDQLQAKHAKAEEQQRQLEGRLGDKEALLCDAALALEARARDKVRRRGLVRLRLCVREAVGGCGNESVWAACLLPWGS